MKNKYLELARLSDVRQGKILVTTNGTFDVLHVGHLRILQKAKEMGDLLLVLVNSDDSVRQNKGPQRPIVPQAERLEMLCGLECVDYVLPFDEKEVMDTLEKIRPDVHVKGGSFLAERVEKEKGLVERCGGKHVCLDMVGNYSTTRLIEKIESCIVADAQ